ncbi:hypothetical protein WG66_008911 [Moniliophthora roreri]|uniref:Uncharacterized protein n=1 Tax=Moniliophthora roreri TaxID=221103 RepID=A0A0W0G5X8_MONRR|nr:hypothetical protein WG66_008911 [Moniliophthora roreri]
MATSSNAHELFPGTSKLLRAWEPLGQSGVAQYEWLLKVSKDTVAQYSSQLQQLQRAIKHHEDNQVQYQSLFAPIRGLPCEVLSQILFYAQEPNYIHPDPRSCKSWATDVSLVCYYWRNLVSSTSIFWASLWVVLKAGVDYPPAVIERLRMHLERSKSIPLKLHIVLCGRGPLSPSGSEVVQLISNASGGWKSLTFCGKDAHFLDIGRLFQQVRIQLNLLEDLDVEMGEDDPGVSHCIFDLVESWPSTIHTLSINHSHHVAIEKVPELSFPFAHLTRLRLENTLQAVLALIGRCENLDSLHLTLIAPKDDEANFDMDDPCFSKRKDATSRRRYPLKRFGNLQELTLELRGLNDTDHHLPFLPLYRVLYSISAPRLATLVLKSDATTHEESPRSAEIIEKGVHEFLARCSPPLLRFHSVCIPFRDMNVIRLLEQMPSLRALVIWEVTNTREGKLIKKGRMCSYRGAPSAMNRIVTRSLLISLTSSQNTYRPNRFYVWYTYTTSPASPAALP